MNEDLGNDTRRGGSPTFWHGHHMRFLDIDDSMIAELVVGMLAARHVAAFARASSHCAELAIPNEACA